jgi:hypothetical protein
MKSRYTLILFALVVGVLLLPQQQAKAQTVVSGDTMYVDWDGGAPSHLPIFNSLRNAVLGDTNTDGTRKNLNRIYLLYVNGIYRIGDRIANPNFTLRLIGQPYTSSASSYPAQIQMVDTRPADASTADARVITGQSDVVLRNLFLTGRTITGVQTAYQPYQIDGSNHTYIIDNCILEQSNFSLIAFTGKNNEIYYTNNKFRNLVGQPSTQQWEGRGISIWADQDTVIVENNTFFNLEFTPFQLEGGSAKYIRFNHNTCVNVGRGINTGNWFQNAYFTNNLFINCWWQGEGFSDLSGSGRDTRQKYNGLFVIGALPSSYGPEEGRRIVFGKNYAYLDPKFTTFYADSIHRAYFVDPVTKLDRLDIYTDHMNVGHAGTTDTVWLTSLPTGFTYPPADVDWLKPKFSVTGATMIDSMLLNIQLLRKGITPATQYFYKPTAQPSDETWPLPENFAYTDATLKVAGTDALPIGDLNWFPTQLATFNSSKVANVTAIENLAGQVVHYTIDSTAEAEFGTLGGTAVKDPFTGFSYFYMQNGGFIQWDFNLTTAGQYGVNILTHLRNQDMRGEHFFVNGNEIHDVIGWGELEFASTQHNHANSEWRGPFMNLDDNSWQWAYFPKDSILAADQSKLAFVAGANTIKITPSWGYQNFSEVDLIAVGATVTFGQKAAAGDIIKELKAPDATSSVVTPMGSGKPWIPSLFNSVSLGSNGSVSMNLNAPTAGNYRIRIFGQNYTSSPITLTVKEGSTTLASPAMPKVKLDTTGVDVISAAFHLDAGAHTIVISGATAYVDYVQLIKEVIGAVGKNGPPSEYALEQNYPNPFNPSTTINFSIGKISNVKLRVYNILGQQVMTLVDTRMTPGAHSVVFDAGKLASGVYFYRLDAGNFVSVKKMLLLK